MVSISIDLVGNGAERHLVVLRGFACTSQCNCAGGLARLFFYFSKTTSTMQQFQRNMNMNVNIPPHPTPPHDQRSIIRVNMNMNVNIPPHPTPWST